MAEYRDYLGDKLRLVERARENEYFRKLDQELLAKMRQEAATTAEQAEEASPRDTNLFTPILVPVDFSPYSVQALERAADVAERFGSSLILLHVIAAQAGVQAVAQHLGANVVAPGTPEGPEEQPEVSDEEVATVIGQHREQAYTALEAFIPPRVAQFPCELRVVFGRPFERIVETAVKEKADLIVLGTHGRTGLARVALGSVAERVVRFAPCPVLTVKAPTPESEGWLKDFYSSFMGDGD